MALVINDRVKENSTTSGTGNITLAGVAAGQGNVTFNSGIGTSNTTYYCIFEQGTNTFEIGLGTLSGSTTLERTTVINNSSCCLLYTSPSPRDRQKSRMPSSA